MGNVGRLGIVKGAMFEDQEILVDAVDKELQHIADTAETRVLDQVDHPPEDIEGRDFERKAFVDVDGLYGTKGARYILYKFPDGWYKTAALTKVR